MKRLIAVTIAVFLYLAFSDTAHAQLFGGNRNDRRTQAVISAVNQQGCMTTHAVGDTNRAISDTNATLHRIEVEQARQTELLRQIAGTQNQLAATTERAAAVTERAMTLQEEAAKWKATFPTDPRLVPPDLEYRRKFPVDPRAIPPDEQYRQTMPPQPTSIAPDPNFRLPPNPASASSRSGVIAYFGPLRSEPQNTLASLKPEAKTPQYTQYRQREYLRQ